MNVDEVLTSALDDVAPLHRPIMVVALRGWFDVAQAATDALDHLVANRVAPVAASIDPDPFMPKESRPGRVQLDRTGNNEHQGGEHKERD